MIENILQDLKNKMDKNIDAYKHNLSSVRAGRATSSFLDQIQIEVYGSLMPINQVSTISVQDSSMLSVQVWDKGNVAATEKAIRTSNLGLNPSSDGNLVRVPMPKLSEQRRVELAKLCGEHSEFAKIAIRNSRRDVLDSFKKLQKNNEISEDEYHTNSDKVQKTTDQYIKNIEELFLAKKEEIISV